MALPKYFTTVTPFSKYLAMTLFVLFPFIAFYLGIQYQKMVTPSYPSTQYIPLSPKPTISTEVPLTVSPPISCRPRPACLDATPRCMIAETSDMCPPATKEPSQTACAQDAKQCPDGSYVGRVGPNCEFAPCPK